MPRPRFPSPGEAYRYSYEILNVWRAGKGFDPDPDRLGGNGTGVMGAVYAAMDIEAVADRHDPGIDYKPGRPTNRKRSWFAQYYIAQERPRNWTEHEMRILNKALCGFCYALFDAKIAERADCAIKCPHNTSKRG